MKRKLGIELYGPCSETGATPNMNDMIATVYHDGRIAFHTILELEKGTDSQWYIRTKDDHILPSSEVYLLYTSNSISNLKETMRKVKDRLGNSY